MMKLHHIGYAVKNLPASAKAFLGLGFVAQSEPFADTGRNVSIQFLEKDGYVIELVCPMNSASPVSGLLSKVGNSPYHLCYEVDALEPELKKLQAESYLVMEMPAVAPAMGGKRVAFLAHRDIGILELVESGSVVA